MLNSLSKKQFADRTDVFRAAKHLMKTFGATTTLEVKDFLRKQGLVAFHNDISRHLKRMAYHLNWDYEFNGRFRIYFLREEGAFSRRNLQLAFSMN